jgi:RNA polymerase sigma factor (sigma-70 family)
VPAPATTQPACDDPRPSASPSTHQCLELLPRATAELRVGPWLYRIATNVALDAFRHRALVRWESLDRAFGTFATALARHEKHRGAEQIDEDGPRVRRHGYKLIDHDRRENPEQAALDAELSAEVRGVLARLSPKYRACLELREYHALSYDEIAAALCTTRAAVKSLLFRARCEFRRHWHGADRPGLSSQSRGDTAQMHSQPGRPASGDRR